MSGLEGIELISLGNYKGVAAPVAVVEVSADEVAAEVERARQMTAEQIEKEVAELGDTVLIDFEGFLGDEKFEGGEGHGVDLKLGSGMFIPGFEEQLVGTKAGADVVVNVTFPEQYQATELAGKPATFKCKVHKVSGTNVPELTDETVAKVSKCNTVEEFKAYVESEIKKVKEEQAKADRLDALMAKIIADTEMNVSDAAIDEELAQTKAQAEQQIASQGADLETFLQYMGESMEEFLADLRERSEQNIKGRAILEAIAAAEAFEASEEDYEKEMEKLSVQYQMPLDQVKKAFESVPKENVELDIIIQKAIDFVLENAIEE